MAKNYAGLVLVARPAAQRALRPEVQALRALAVMLVVLFHLWPERLSGGYIGVDVFFVVSGFLITLHLHRELAATGTVVLHRFWARRIRRLLPAALLVLLMTGGAVLLWVPRPEWLDYFREILASALYVENWLLAADSVDYLAAENSASPAQHYWSLSVEEQFYVLWPLLLMLAAVIGRRSRLRSLGLVIGGVAAGGLLVSIVFTASNPSEAYFVTPTRIWEFAAGGLVAVMLGSRPLPWPAPVRGALLWIGVAAIVAAAMLYDARTPFPGSAALIPVLGTVLVLCAGDVRSWWSPMVLGRLRPVQWLGDVSYSVYLWHWPLIVIAPFVLDRSLGGWDRVVLLLATLALSHLSTRLVEDPIRQRAQRLPNRSWPAFAAMAGGIAAVSIVPVLGIVAVQNSIRDQAALVDAFEERVEADAECLGPDALHTVEACAAAETMSAITPDPAGIEDAERDACITTLYEDALTACVLEPAVGAVSREIAMIGDSHAEHWRAGLQIVADTLQWRVHLVAKSSCPLVRAERVNPGGPESEMRRLNRSCNRWNQRVQAYLEGRAAIDAVVVSASARNQFRPQRGMTWQETVARGYEEAWAALPATVLRIVVLRDAPRNPEGTLACIAEESTAFWPCGGPRTERLLDDPQANAAVAANDPRILVVDLSDAFCTSETCYPVIGRALAYRDDHHLSDSYAELLGPLLAEELQDAIGGAASRPAVKE